MYKLPKLTRLPISEGKLPLNSLNDKSLTNSLFQVDIIQNNTHFKSLTFLFRRLTVTKKSTINNYNSKNYQGQNNTKKRNNGIKKIIQRFSSFFYSQQANISSNKKHRQTTKEWKNVQVNQIQIANARRQGSTELVLVQPPIQFIVSS